MPNLSWRDIKVSGGPEISEGDGVRLLYRVALSEADMIEGRHLESTFSPERPLEFRVRPGELLEGVYLGLVGMRSGGSIRRLIVPPQLGYGGKSWGPIPANATLVIDLLASLVTKSDSGGD